MRNLSFYSLCLVAGLTCAYGEQQSGTNSSADSNSAVIAAPESIKDKAKNAAKTLLTDFSAKGFIFGRNFFISGSNGSGASWQYRAKIDITTGKVNGYSLTGGIMLAQGSSAIDKGRVTDGDVQGSRGIAFNDNFSDRFNVAQIYGSKEFSLDSIRAKIDIGRMNLVSPLNDKNLDIGLGGRVKFSHKLGEKQEIGYELLIYDSWTTDNLSFNIRRRDPKQGTTSIPDSQRAAIGIGNNLSMIHIYGKGLSGLDFNVVYANIFRMFDALFLGDVSYKLKFGQAQLGFLAQTSFAAMNASPHVFLGHRGRVINTTLETEFYKFSARYRGIYNLQMNLKLGGLSTKVGFLGSFSQGYGVMLSARGIINTAGAFWNSNMTATYEGFGIFGAGSFSGTSIGVPYVSISYKFPFKLQVGLDATYLFGNNNFPVLDATTPSRTVIDRSETIKTGKQKFINAKFAEITPSIQYEFLKNFNFIFRAGFFVGDIQFIKTQAEVRYVF